MKILNKDALDQWIFERIQAGHSVVSIKDEPPAGALDSDGDPEFGLINVAWQDTTTGEVFGIEYDVPGDAA